MKRNPSDPPIGPAQGDKVARTPAKTPTLRDVARVAGVSIKTVSRVVNEEAHVTKETMERVRQAIAELAYVPNLAGRRLVHGRSFILAVIYQNRSWNWLNDLQRGAIEQALSSGYEVLMRPVVLDDPREREAIGRLLDQGSVDGFVLTPPCGDSEPLRERLRDTPHVAISPTASPDMPTVGVDDVRGATSMTEHLLDLGHRRIGFVLGEPAQASTPLRLRGFTEALRARDLKVDPELVGEGDFSFDSGVRAADELLTRDPRITAIFASNDDMAAGILVAAHRRGLRVPDDLSVAGFDDVDLSRMVAPALTTVRQPTGAMGRRAVERLLARLDGVEDATHEEFATELIIRGSTGAPPSR